MCHVLLITLLNQMYLNVSRDISNVIKSNVGYLNVLRDNSNVSE